MCGIVGILQRDPLAQVDRSLLERMTAMLSHRGPDERGILIDGPLGFGHRRLSVIDLSTGQQPMVDAARSRAIVFNGEIYNHRALRDAMPAGERASLRTASDTEVLLRIVDPDDLEPLERLNGMFGFALWDGAARRLLLARDRLGIKPLYVADLGDAFVFASEIKPLLLHPRMTRRLNAARVAEQLAFRGIAGDETLFEGIRQVPPGHAMTLEAPAYRPRVARYWREGVGHPASAYADPAAAVDDQFLEIFEDAVRQRLVSDVPVGTFNSGGLDSSLVTALVRSMKPGELHTFSVGFEESSHDERRYAEQVATAFGTEHHAIVVGRDEYAARLDEALWHLEEPINHPHTVQLLLLSRVAKRFVTVVLTGEGSDELFGGYPRYQIARVRQAIDLMPAGVRHWLASAIGRLDGHRAARLAEGLSRDAAALAVSNAKFVPQVELDGLGLRGGAYAHRDRMFAEPYQRLCDPLGRLLYHDQRTYLPSLLMRLDRTTMAAGVEARVPFLDYRLVEWSYKLDSRHKIRGLTGKRIVKRAARRLLPREIVERPKMGFDVPVAQWLRSGVGLGQRLDLLADSTFRQRGLFDPKAVGALIDAHRRGAADHAEALWGLLGLEMWLRAFIDEDPCRAWRAGPPPAQVAPVAMDRAA